MSKRSIDISKNTSDSSAGYFDTTNSSLTLDNAYYIAKGSISIRQDLTVSSNDGKAEKSAFPS